MSADFHYLSLDEVARRLKARTLTSVDATKAILDRIDRLDPKLKSYATLTPRASARGCRRAGCRDRSRHLARSAARRADRGEGSLQHRGRGDGRRDGDPSCQRADRRRHRRRAAQGQGRGDPGQAADDRGRVRRAPSQHCGAAQSLERGVLDRRVLVGLRRGDGGRPVLRLARLRHRRLDPLSQHHERAHRPEADLGPGQPRRRLCRSPSRSTISAR